MRLVADVARHPSFPDDQCRRVRADAVRDRAIALSQPGQLAFVDLHGLGDDYLTGYVRRVVATTPEDVRRSAERHLAPERMTLVVVGDEKTAAPQVAPFARTSP